MTSEKEQLEEAYLGEPSPRSPGVAAGLSLLSPGLGWLYVGRASEALLLNGALVVVVVTALALWNVLQFFPLVPLGLLCIGVVAVVLMAALDAARAAWMKGDRFFLREYNNPLAYVAFAIGTWILPIALALAWTMGAHWTFHTVLDDAMHPTLIEGDVLLVSRVTSELQRGDIVLLREPSGIERTVRVIGLPGDTVAYTEDSMYVNDSPLPRAVMDDGARQELASLAVQLRDDVEYFVEQDARVAWPGAAPRTGHWSQVEAIALEEGRVFVMNDHRGRLTDSRDAGALPADWIVGRPLFVMRSRPPASFSDEDAAESYRRARVGRRVQAAPARRVR